MIASTIFTDLDVSPNPLTVAQAMYASMLCKNVLDTLALKEGKPTIKSWLVEANDLQTNGITKGLYGGWLLIMGEEDTEFNREKYAVTSCPFTQGSGGEFVFQDTRAAFELAKTLSFDSLVYTGHSLIIVSKLGTGRGVTDLTETKVDPVPVPRTNGA
jgi:hypothetical protein